MWVWVCVGVGGFVCVIEHLFSPPFATALGAHVTKSSPRELCARTHTRKTLSRPGGVESRSQLVELGAARCVGTCVCWAVFKIHFFYVCFVPANSSRQTVPAHSRQTMPIHNRLVDPVRRSQWQGDWTCPQQAEAAFAF